MMQCQKKLTKPRPWNAPRNKRRIPCCHEHIRQLWLRQPPCNIFVIAQAAQVPRRGTRHGIPSGRSERRPPPSETEGVPPPNHSADVRHGLDERTELSRQKYHAEKSERVDVQRFFHMSPVTIGCCPQHAEKRTSGAHIPTSTTAVFAFFPS